MMNEVIPYPLRFLCFDHGFYDRDSFKVCHDFSPFFYFRLILTKAGVFFKAFFRGDAVALTSRFGGGCLFVRGGRIDIRPYGV